MRRTLWTLLWLSLAMNIIYLAETDLWLKRPLRILLAAGRDAAGRYLQ